MSKWLGQQPVALLLDPHKSRTRRPAVFSSVPWRHLLATYLARYALRGGTTHLLSLPTKEFAGSIFSAAGGFGRQQVLGRILSLHRKAPQFVLVPSAFIKP